MPMTVTYLDPVHPVDVSDHYGGQDHPMRVVTREVAFDNTWDAERRATVRSIFDGLAEEWAATRSNPERMIPLEDALCRGEVHGTTALELGAGTGIATQVLQQHFSTVATVDLSPEMLFRAPEAALRVCADAQQLPFANDTADVLVLMNMLLFPAEVDRCLAPGGALVWVNSRSGDTPIHLPAEDVVAALPGHWQGVASYSGTASWCVARRF